MSVCILLTDYMHIYSISIDKIPWIHLRNIKMPYLASTNMKLVICHKKQQFQVGLQCVADSRYQVAIFIAHDVWSHQEIKCHERI